MGEDAARGRSGLGLVRSHDAAASQEQEQDAGEFMDGYAPNPNPTQKIPHLGGGKASFLIPSHSHAGFRFLPLDTAHATHLFAFSLLLLFYRPFQTSL